MKSILKLHLETKFLSIFQLASTYTSNSILQYDIYVHMLKKKTTNIDVDIDMELM